MSQIGVPDHTEVQRARVAQCNTVKNGCSTRDEGFPSRVAGCGAIGKGESTRLEERRVDWPTLGPTAADRSENVWRKPSSSTCAKRLLRQHNLFVRSTPSNPMNAKLNQTRIVLDGSGRRRRRRRRRLLLFPLLLLLLLHIY